MSVFEQGWTDQAALDVLHNLRAPDIAELVAVHGVFDPFQVHAQLRVMMGTAAYMGIFRADALADPFAIAGVWERWPGNGNAFMVCTPEVERHGWAFIRHLRQRVQPEVAALGFNRIDCQSDARNILHHRLIRAFGGEEEVTLPQFGRAGEAVKQFVWYPRRSVPNHATPTGDNPHVPK